MLAGKKDESSLKKNARICAMSSHKSSFQAWIGKQYSPLEKIQVRQLMEKKRLVIFTIISLTLVFSLILVVYTLHGELETKFRVENTFQISEYNLNALFIYFELFLMSFGILVIFSFAKSFITCREQDLGYLMAIGVYYRELRRSIWKILLYFYLISILFSIPLSSFLYQKIIQLLNINLNDVSFHYDINCMCIISLIMLFMISLGTFGPLRHLKKINLVQVMNGNHVA